MKIRKILLTFIAAMSLGVSHADLGTVIIDLTGTAVGDNSHWMSLVSTNNLYFNSSYTNGKDHELEGGECFAFKAVAGDLENGIVYLKHISVVRAGTPIWIWGSKEAHSITTFTDLGDISTHDYPISFDNIYGNLLFGSASETTTTKAGDYVLSKQDDYVHAVTSAMVGNALPAGKCLLRLRSASRATLSIGLLDDETEGIDAVMTRDGELIMYDPSKPSFDAQGRRIDPQQKGLHIQNGYKFIIK